MSLRVIHPLKNKQVESRGNLPLCILNYDQSEIHNHKVEGCFAKIFFQLFKLSVARNDTLLLMHNSRYIELLFFAPFAIHGVSLIKKLPEYCYIED